jgi:hypothetical protein
MSSATGKRGTGGMLAVHRRSASTGSRRTRPSVASAVALALLCLGLGASPAAAAPIWRLDALANTTAAPGSTFTYKLQLKDIGDVSSDGTEVDLTATLPSGITAVSAGGGAFTCTAADGSPVSGASDVKCTSTTQYPRWATITPVITVAVDPSASGVLTAAFQVSGGGADPVSTVTPVRISATPPGFGAGAFDQQIVADPAGNAYSQAGGHPYAITTSIDFNTVTNPNPLIGPLWPVEPAKDAVVDLPPGLVGDPTVADTCTIGDLANSQAVNPRSLCSPTSQVGTAMIRTSNPPGLNLVFGPLPVYNLVTPANVPALFGFNMAGTVVTMNARLRSSGDYGLSVDARNIPEGLAIAGTTVTFWGTPSDTSHDAERACPGVPAPWQRGPTCPGDASGRAFLRNPTSCAPAPGGPSDGLQTSLHLDSWFNPGSFRADGSPDPADPHWVDASVVSHAPPAYPYPSEDFGSRWLPTGCENVPFDAALSGGPSSVEVQPGEPSGFTFDLTIPQDDTSAISEGDLKKAVVTLPEGVRLSPASADGLGACTPDQIGLHAPSSAGCPDNAKIGSVTIDTPVLNQPLTGSIFLAKPYDNPFGSLFAIYLVAEGSGVVIKVPGKVEANDRTGQLTATFDDAPQLPFSQLHLAFFGGPRASLVTPKTCGTYTTHSELTSWSGKTVPGDSTFTLSAGPCGPTGFTPGFLAGMSNPIAGADSSFLLSLSRADGDQDLKSVTVDMPTGLTGRIANVVLCPSGEGDAGHCQAVSRIGNVTVGAGAGSNPFFITNGSAYLTGPYKGAPYGLSMVVPAIAGPFDLGTVVVRAAVFVDPDTARLRIVSDTLPTILKGIPLDLRAVRVTIDRPHFTVNPHSCDERHVLGTITSIAGAVAHVASRFQVTKCTTPPLNKGSKLAIAYGARGHTRAGVSTPLTATLTQASDQVPLRSVAVSLPTTLNALLPVLNRACSLHEFHAGTCGAGARVGSAVAVTPLLRDPLRGSVYFVRNPKRVLPDLMVALRGQVAIDLTGKVAIGTGNRLGTKFDTIPDVPISKFSLRLVSGRNGPIGTVTNLCSARARRAKASVTFRGQNGRVMHVRERLHIVGCRRHHTRGR